MDANNNRSMVLLVLLLLLFLLMTLLLVCRWGVAVEQHVLSDPLAAVAVWMADNATQNLCKSGRKQVRDICMRGTCMYCMYPKVCCSRRCRYRCS